MNKNLISSIVSLFASSTTLVCCALPALFITLGAGAVLVGLISAVPSLIWISKHKIYFFAFAAIGLIIAGLMEHKSKYLPCPVEEKARIACLTTRKWSKRIYISSVTIYLVGVFFAFILPYIKNNF